MRDAEGGKGDVGRRTATGRALCTDLLSPSRFPPSHRFSSMIAIVLPSESTKAESQSS